MPDGEVTWAAAFVFLRWLNRTGGGICGYSDWRIPNIRELRSLTGYGPLAPMRDPIFVNPPALGFWSSTWYEPAQSPLGVIRFNGNTFFGRSNQFNLLPVRAGNPIFVDGFEIGHTGAWSSAVP